MPGKVPLPRRGPAGLGHSHLGEGGREGEREGGKKGGREDVGNPFREGGNEERRAFREGGRERGVEHHTQTYLPFLAGETPSDGIKLRLAILCSCRGKNKLSSRHKKKIDFTTLFLLTPLKVKYKGDGFSLLHPPPLPLSPSSLFPCENVPMGWLASCQASPSLWGEEKKG